MMNDRKLLIGAGALILLAAILACSSVSLPGPTWITPSAQPPNLTSTTITNEVDREALIPRSAVKMSPDTDPNPPRLYSGDYEPPVPAPGQVNTAGAEDGVFVTPTGDTMYFFFTPDVNVPVEKQILDGVTGLYGSQKQNSEHTRP